MTGILGVGEKQRYFDFSGGLAGVLPTERGVLNSEGLREGEFGGGGGGLGTNE